MLFYDLCTVSLFYRVRLPASPESKGKSTQMASWNRRKFMEIAPQSGPKGIWEIPVCLTCNMMHTKGGAVNLADRLFHDFGVARALTGPKLGVQGTPKSMLNR